tara:strand:+ start:514 stop:867 length:354 start_codon:yes stop_codon:yes gene_type:complete
MRKFLIIFVFFLSGCSNYRLESINSSDDFYVLTPEVIESIIHLNICESQSGKCDLIRTGASHVHYWGADWFKSSNIVVLYSSDIGTYAWVKSDSWEQIEITQEIREFADKIYEELKK